MKTQKQEAFGGLARPQERLLAIYVLGAVLLGLALRVVQLDFQPLWWDEGYSVFFATRAFGDMLARTAVDIHPPLYYALLEAWIAAVGKDVVVLRLLSVVIGVVAIPLSYLLARQLFEARTGIVAAYLFAIAPLHIYYAQELRMYGLGTVLALASIVLQVAVLRGERNWRGLLAGYVLVTTALIYTEYFAAFLIGAQILVVLYLRWRVARALPLGRWAAAWAAIAVLYLPWLVYAGPKLYTYVTAKVGIEQYAPLDPLTFSAQHLSAFSIGHVSDWTWLAWGGVLFVGIALAGVVIARRGQKGASTTTRGQDTRIVAGHGYTLATIYLVTPLALGLLVNLLYPFHPIHYERSLLYAAPLFLILVARGVVELWGWKRAAAVGAAAAIAVVCALSLYDFYTVERYADEDYRTLIREMEGLAQANDLALAIYPWQIGYLEAYYRGAALDVYEAPSDEWTNDSQKFGADLAELRTRQPRIWLLAYQKQGRILEDRLTNEFINDYVIADDWFGNTRLEYFAQAGDGLSGEETREFAPDLKVMYRVPEGAVDGTVPVQLNWQTPVDEYNYSLRLVGANGDKIAQEDAPIPPGGSVIRRALPIGKDVAPGMYRLELVAYQRADGTPLALPDGATELELGAIEITR